MQRRVVAAVHVNGLFIGGKDQSVITVFAASGLTGQFLGVSEISLATLIWHSIQVPAVFVHPECIECVE